MLYSQPDLMSAGDRHDLFKTRARTHKIHQRSGFFMNGFIALRADPVHRSWKNRAVTRGTDGHAAPQHNPCIHRSW